MCLMPRIYLTAIYGDPQQRDATEPDVPPEETSQAPDEQPQELVPA